jgi:pimeloyl-ACP methyl ester carboxylesterase
MYGFSISCSGRECAVALDALAIDRAVPQRTMDSLVEHDDTQHLAQIAVPALLLWGSRRAVLASRSGRALSRPCRRLTVYEETGHCPNRQWPEQVAAEIADFVSRL